MCVRCVVRFFDRLHRNSAGILDVWQGISGQYDEDIKRRIVIGELKAGDKLPSNAELALAYQVNPNTVQRIYRQLEAEGISYTKRGIGTFLMENPEMPEQLRQEIGEKLSAQFLAQMATYHFSKEEIIHLLEAQAQQQEKEGTSC